MRRCPICGQSFGDDACYCPVDGCCLAPIEARGPLVGLRLEDRYFIEERIGSGGLGEVYRARHIKMGKSFALKVLVGAVKQDDQHAARFDREARVLSLLKHPFCVEVTDYGHSEHGPYIVMELVDGAPLSHYTKGAGLALGEAVDVVIKVLIGLEHAHGHGIIHRDIKPDNIMLVASLTEPGKRDPKILDFGLAKLQPGYVETGDVEALTAPGKVVGTPAYLAPERIVAAKGGPIDHSVDLYALGVILYELCCGKRPFFSEDLAAIVRQHLLLDPPPPTTVRPELPPLFDEVILKALAKKPSERYPSAAAFRQALEGLLPLPPDLAAAVPPAQAERAAAEQRPGDAPAVVDPAAQALPAVIVAPASASDEATRLTSPPRLSPLLNWRLWIAIGAGGLALIILLIVLIVAD